MVRVDAKWRHAKCTSERDHHEVQIDSVKCSK
jgi:hypothetical protein